MTTGICLASLPTVVGRNDHSGIQTILAYMGVLSRLIGGPVQPLLQVSLRTDNDDDDVLRFIEGGQMLKSHAKVHFPYDFYRVLRMQFPYETLHNYAACVRTGISISHARYIRTYSLKASVDMDQRALRL